MGPTEEDKNSGCTFEKAVDSLYRPYDEEPDEVNFDVSEMDFEEE